MIMNIISDNSRQTNEKEEIKKIQQKPQTTKKMWIKINTHLNFHAVNRIMPMHQLNYCSLHLRGVYGCVPSSVFFLLLLLYFSFSSSFL